MKRPVVYIASPYTKGDVAINTYFQCSVFNRLLDDKKVWPIAPLWSHFQHTVFPRKYEDWIEYDQALLERYDACLRVNPDFPQWDYRQIESSGAEAEVQRFVELGKPVFYSIDDLYNWADRL